VTVILCANLVTGAFDLMQRDLPRLVAEQDVPAPVIPARPLVAVDPAALAGWEGTQQLRPGSTIELRRCREGLMANDWLPWSTGEGEFFSAQDDATVRARRDAAGAVVALEWVGVHGPATDRRVATAAD
jgi:hypothetical protein